MIQELLPALVARMSQMDMDEGIASGFLGLPDEFHMGLGRRSSPLLGITANACADDVSPDGLPPHAARHHVIKGQVSRRKVLPTVLTAISVPGK